MIGSAVSDKKLISPTKGKAGSETDRLMEAAGEEDSDENKAKVNLIS